MSEIELRDRIVDALLVASSYGQTDGDHHKAWVIDQMVRYLTGCPLVSREAIDAYGKPYTFLSLGESDEYRSFVAQHNAGEDGPDTYGWSGGIAP